LTWENASLYLGCGEQKRHPGEPWKERDDMVEVREMPYSEKYAKVLGAIKHDEHVSALIEKHLGQAASSEYRKICESGIQPIPEETSPEQKYEIAYKNWMWISSVAFNFVRERMGEEGIEQMVSAGVASLKRENSSPSLYLLRLIRAISPGLAFEILAKRSAYEFQWLTPYSVDELSRQREVMNIPRCKILDYPNTEDACLVGCQREYPQWLAEQLKVNMQFNRQGHSCTATITPLH
jgi:hypothetical protein